MPSQFPFSLWDGSNDWNDEFHVVHATLRLDDYEAARRQLEVNEDRAAYAVIAKVLSEIGPYVRFIAVSLDTTKQIPNPQGLTDRQIKRLVYKYIGVSQGYLGDFSYQKHADFYTDLDLDINPYNYPGTTRERFMQILSESDVLLLSVEKRLSSGFAILGSYTFAKLISDSAIVPSNFGAVEVGSDNGYQNGKYDRRAERSVDPTDVSNRLVLSGIYELPFGKGKRWNPSSGLANGLIGGWQLNLIGTLQGGLPLVVRGANNFLANRPSSTGVSAKLENPTPERWFDTTQFVNPPNFTFGNIGRTLPDVRGPGAVNFDLSLIKYTQLFESLRLQFRAEAFNFLNHTNYGNPNVTFSPGPDGRNTSATFGTITSAREPRIIQFGLRMIF